MEVIHSHLFNNLSVKDKITNLLKETEDNIFLGFVEKGFHIKV